LDVFNLYAKLSLNTSEYEKGVEKAKGGASSLMDVFSGTVLGNAVTDGLRNIANGFVTIGKMATGAAISIGKSSLDSYGEYEQLIGGVETLYKDSAKVVEQYAKRAFKNVGMSANDYMETSTSFAASLVSSLAGDTNAAAEMSNMAISDMADNWNKMGSSVQSVQDAYRGFSKQNYVMLDNLKIGYGGTKTEMERLLADADALNAKQGVYTKYSIDNFSDIVQAIHVVQTEMGITGTTADEAASTIQGSTASVKSAWDNLLTGIADPEQNFQWLMDDFVNSFVTAGDNIIPRIKQIVPTLIDGLSEIVTQLAPYVSSIIMELEPTIEEGLQALFGGLSSVASELQPIVADVFSFFGDAIISGLTSAIENSDFSFLLDIFDNVKTAVEEVVPLIEKIAPALVTVGAAAKGWEIGKKLQSIVTGFDEAKVAVSLFSMGLSDTEIAQGALNGTLKASEVVAGLLTGKISLMTLAQTAAAKAQAAFNAVLAANPIALVIVAIGALVGILAVLYAKNEDFRNKVNASWDAISAKIQEVVAFVQPYVEAAMQVIGQVVTQVITDLTPVIQSIGEAFSAAWSLVQTVWSWASAFFQAIFQTIVVIFAPFAPIISGFFQGAWIIIQSIWNVAVSFFQTVFDLITGVFSTIDAVLSGDFQSAWESIQGIFEGAFGFFSTVGQNVVNGIKGGIAAVWGGLVSWFNGLWDNLFGNRSVNVDVNSSGTDGSHAGGLDYVPYNNYVANLHRGEMVLTSEEATQYRKGNENAAGGMTFNININGIQFSDVNSMAHALANQISYELQAQSNRKAAVYA
jgi:phage-related protein